MKKLALILPVFILLLMITACGDPTEEYFGISPLDIRGMIYISEVHWAGSVDDSGQNANLNDDFIELRSWHKGVLDISGWNVVVEGDQYLIITIPDGTLLESKEYYSIGNNTNGAFTEFDLIVSNLTLPPGDFEIDIYDGGGAKHADSADFTSYDVMPAGYDLPNLKKSAVRLTDYFGPKSTLEPWADYNANTAGSGVRAEYQSSVLASPGEGLGEVGETGDNEG